MSTHDMADQRRQRRRDDRRRGRGGAGEGLYPRHLLGAVPLLFSWELVADPLRYPRTWSSVLNAFLHPASERFLFNATGGCGTPGPASRRGSSGGG
jgi:hypothetical protein